MLSSTTTIAMPLADAMIGTIRALRTNTGRCSIVWQFMDREVWLDEVNVRGPKRAIYEWRPTQRVVRQVVGLEAEAVAAVERLEAANECDAPDDFEGTVIESDPFVVA